MKSAFTLIEVLAAIFILSIVIVVSFQSMSYMNQTHQQNEIRYLALNCLDSEMSRLVMADKNTTYDISGGAYKHGNSDLGTQDGDYGLKIASDGRNFVQLKDIRGDFNKVEDGDFVAILSWTQSDDNVTLTLKYPYIYKGGDVLQNLWYFDEEITLKTSIKS